MTLQSVRTLIESFTPQDLQEFKGDLKKQYIVLMGLPASGKSTFVKKELQKHVPGIQTGFSVSNSDAQVTAFQYQRAVQDFEQLQAITTQDELTDFIQRTAYVDNQGNPRTLPLSLPITFDNAAAYYKAMRVPFYGSYFDMREQAKVMSLDLFKTKMSKGTNLVVVDTVASKPKKILKDMEAAKKDGYQTSIFYLEMDPALCIARDLYRGKTDGRSVGEKIIMDYAANMDAAYKVYKEDGKDPDGSIDRLFRFTWSSTSPKPSDGNWVLAEKHIYDVRRELNARTR